MDQTTYDASAPRRKRRRALIAILLAASLATLSTGAMTMALFTDTETGTGSWSTGTIDLDLNPTAMFSVTGIMPGDTGEQTVQVQNNGTGELRYVLDAAVQSDPVGLAGQMVMTVNAGDCDTPGDELYSGALSGTAFGDPTPGDDGDERVVAASGNDYLCFAWEFPRESDNGFQDTTASVNFVFDAEQTKNN